MNELYDVIIIGGGVVGCGTARELMRRRAKVLLLAGSRWAGQGLGWECGWKGEDGAEPGQTRGQEAQQHGASLRFGSRMPCGWKLSCSHFWLRGCWV